MHAVTCPKCKAKLKTRQALPPGKPVKCPKCSQAFRAPKAAAGPGPVVLAEPPAKQPLIQTSAYAPKKRGPLGIILVCAAIFIVLGLIGGAVVFAVVVMWDQKMAHTAKTGQTPKTKPANPEQTDKTGDNKKGEGKPGGGGQKKDDPGKKTDPKTNDKKTDPNPPKDPPKTTEPKWNVTWTPFESKTGAFKIEFPGQPKEMRVVGNGVGAQQFKVELPDQMSTFLVRSHLVIGNEADKGASVILDESAKAFIKNEKQREPLILGTNAGIEVKQIAPGFGGKNAVSVDRIFLVGNRLYHVYVSTNEAPGAAEARKRFLDSFRAASLPDAVAKKRPNAPSALTDVTEILTFAYSPRGTRLATVGSGADGVAFAQVWDRTQNDKRIPLEILPGRWDALAISADDAVLACVKKAGEGPLSRGTVELWDLKTGKMRSASANITWTRPKEARAWAKFNLAGDTLYFGGGSNFSILDVNGNGTVKSTYGVGSNRRAAADYSPMINMFVVMSFDPAKGRTDFLTTDALTNDGRKGASLAKEVLDVCFSGDGRRFAYSYVSDDGWMAVGKTNTGGQAWSLGKAIKPGGQPGRKGYHRVMLSQNGSLLAAMPLFDGKQPAVVELFRTDTGQKVGQIACPNYQEMVVAPDGVTLTVALKNGLKHYEMATGNEKAAPGPPLELVIRDPFADLYATWRLFPAPDAELSVKLPTGPQSGAGNTTLKRTFFGSHPKKNVLYTFRYGEIPADLQKNSPEDNLKKLLRFATAGVPPQEANRGKNITVLGKPGMEFAFENRRRKSYTKVRVIVTEKYIVNLEAEAKFARALPREGQAFLHSLRFSKTPKTTPVGGGDTPKGWVRAAPPNSQFSALVPSMKPYKFQTLFGAEYKRSYDGERVISTATGNEYFIRQAPIGSRQRKQTAAMVIQRFEVSSRINKNSRIKSTPIKLGPISGVASTAKFGDRLVMAQTYLTKEEVISFTVYTKNPNATAKEISNFFSSISHANARTN